MTSTNARAPKVFALAPVTCPCCPATFSNGRQFANSHFRRMHEGADPSQKEAARQSARWLTTAAKMPTELTEAEAGSVEATTNCAVFNCLLCDPKRSVTKVNAVRHFTDCHGLPEAEVRLWVTSRDGSALRNKWTLTHLESYYGGDLAAVVEVGRRKTSVGGGEVQVAEAQGACSDEAVRGEQGDGAAVADDPSPLAVAQRRLCELAARVYHCEQSPSDAMAFISAVVHRLAPTQAAAVGSPSGGQLASAVAPEGTVVHQKLHVIPQYLEWRPSVAPKVFWPFHDHAWGNRLDAFSVYLNGTVDGKY